MLKFLKEEFNLVQLLKIIGGAIALFLLYQIMQNTK